MSSVLNEESDAVLESLQSSILSKTTHCRKLRGQLSYLVDSSVSPLKEKLTDAVIDRLLTSHQCLTSQFSGFLDQCSGFQHGAESLQMEIASVEKLKTALEKASDVACASRDLRRCEAGMRASIASNDLFGAAQHLVDARKIMESGHLDQSLEQPIVDSVRGLEKQLVKTVGRHFKEGVLQRDHAVVSRYVKLFYPLNLHKEGISCYLGFLRESLSNECASNFKILIKDEFKEPVGDPIYANVLTKVFEKVVHFIEVHHQNVETELGLDTYLLFLRGLEEEADIQAVRVLDKFQDEHQELLSATPETLPVNTLKNVDLTLEELALISCRCQQFIALLHRTGTSTVSQLRSTNAALESDDHHEKYSSVHGLATLSALARRIQELMGFYVSLEHAYTSVSLKKALGDAEIAVEDTERFISTLPDDVFFILRKVIFRSLASRDNFVVCAVVNLLSGLLSSLVRPYLDQALQSSARFYSEWAASRFRPVPSVAEDYKTALQSFALSPKSGDVASDRNVTKWGTTHPPTPCCSARLSWPHLFNDLATCIEYINSLVTASEAEFLKHQNAETEAEQGRQLMFQQSLLGLAGTKKEFQSSLQLFTAMLIDPMLQPVLVPLFRDFASVPFTIDQQAFADFQVNDPFMNQFMEKMTQVIDHCRSIYIPTCFSSIMDALVTHLTLKFEDCILKKDFTLLGTVQLEADIRALLGRLTLAVDCPLLSKFARLMEMLEILCVVSVEELQQLLDPLSMGKSWKLSLRDIQQVIQRRVDLEESDLQKVFVELSCTAEPFASSKQ